MDDRTMPTATFRCPESGDQTTTELTMLVRVAGHPDYVTPVPTCQRTGCSRKGRAMRLLQIQYSDHTEVGVT